MAQAARLNLRLQKELKLLLTDPPPRSSFPLLFSGDSNLSSLSAIDAQIEGPEGTVYAKGVFKIKIQIPERYPFQPPIVTFTTPIYHPNIDNGGRICLDILNLPPNGAWQPSLNIFTVLTSIGLLLSEPNPDDGLMCEASREYKYNRQAFDQKAQAMTEKYAKNETAGNNSSRHCIQPHSDSSTEFKVEGLDEESKHEANEFMSSHKRPSGISRKLSLESSVSSYKGDANEEANHFQNSREAKGEREILGVLSDESTLNSEKLSGTKRKLSLQSSAAPKCSGSLSSQPAASVACSESIALKIGSICEHADHQPADSKSMDGRKHTSLEKLCWISSTSSRHLDFAETSDTDANNRKMPVSSQSSPSKFRTTSSTRPSCMPLSVTYNEQIHCKESVCEMENGSTNIVCKKICPTGKKLSLGFKHSSQGEAEDKTNVATIHNLPLPNPEVEITRMAGIRRKLSLGPLTQSQNASKDAYKEQAIENEDDKCNVGAIKQWGEESSIPESIIVLDSEDSENENHGSVRSRLSLTRKRRGKHKAIS